MVWCGMFDMANYKEITRLPHDLMAFNVAFSPDGQSARFFVMSKAMVCEVRWQGNQRNRPMLTTSDATRRLHPDGRLLATSEGFGNRGSGSLIELASGKALLK